MQRIYPTSGFFARHAPQLPWPAECFKHLHDPVPYFEWLWELTLDDYQKERIIANWWHKFFCDTSGRSTGKSHDNNKAINTKNVLIPGRVSIMLALNEDTEREIFQKILEPSIVEDTIRNRNLEGRFAQFVSSRRRGEQKATYSSGRIELYLKTDSYYYSVPPGVYNEAKNTQSKRTNDLLINEFTSWPDVSIFQDIIKPINSNTAVMTSRTQQFRELAESHLGQPLGRLTNEQAVEFIYQWKKEFLAESDSVATDADIFRPHLIDPEPLDSFEEVRRRFFHNFQLCFEFPYSIGRKRGFLPPIESEKDIVDFFSEYTLGDPVYDNTVIYEGSSKEEDSQYYDIIEMFQNQMDAGNPFYKWVSYSITDVSKEFEGIIYDPIEVADAYKNMSKDEFMMVYGGKWRKTPGDEVYEKAVRDMAFDIGQRHSITIQTERTDPKAIHIAGADAAKGTERSRSGKSSTGDDAAAAIWQPGIGTPENPHRLLYMYVPEDVRPSWFAMDLYRIDQRFDLMWLGLDPGGGGGEVADWLGKDEILYHGEVIEKLPIVPYDYEGDAEEFKNALMFFSRGNEIIKSAFIKASSAKATWRSDDLLVHKMHEKVHDLMDNGGVAFPPYRSDNELDDLHRNGQLTTTQYKAYKDTMRAVEQLGNLKRAKGKDGKFEINSQGVYKYTSNGKKDKAYALLYGAFLCHVWTEVQRIAGNLGGDQDDEFNVALGSYV